MSDERDIRADDDTAVNRPSGKRSARRSRTSSSDTGSIATIDRNGSGPAGTASRKASKPADKKAGRGTGNPFKRLVKFLREVIAELRKVIWPNRKQMVTYTSVVLVFVVFMVAFIYGMDLAFFKGVDWLFG
ncbi:preprotein translocase subunit SecE [Nocardia pseudobrasiliensis]|uniref:Protein translocase subunit SecE n=1 Tax=Nocardia pseudobrasiliensis TaxID=45979 RepID=A0A370I774_9NOCA|nr:preprotein translocase subunit SecE [Nocardia pseudobrasiliensis]RDI66480.1 protein translocase subunit secE/sec61 gamma [Nocardia pseudobrasiliensis]